MPQRDLILGSAVLALNIWATAAHGVTNPAADFCVKEGGTYIVVKEAAGERGICTLPDGRAVDAWDYFRERHLTSPPATKSGDAADTIWRGGPILTMSDGAVRASALAVKDGRILAVGAEAQVMAHRG